MAGELEQTNKQSWLESTKSYLHDIRSEMKRVTWPSRAQVESTTIVVLVSVFIFAAYFKVVDQILQVTIVRAQNALIK